MTKETKQKTLSKKERGIMAMFKEVIMLIKEEKEKIKQENEESEET